MNPFLLLVAVWLYGGRALLLCLADPVRGDGRAWRTPLWFGLGLLLTPLLIAAMTGVGSPQWVYRYLFLLLGAVDVALLTLVIRRRPALSGGAIAGVAFALLCITLTWFNGPLVEHLSDAWWHMGNIASMRDSGSLELPLRSRSVGLFSSGAMTWLGVDFSSYRMQAALSALAGVSVLESWYASTATVSGLLAFSTLLLFRAVLGETRATVLAALFWLMILGGMNTGFRITGWPAGMGYVFLNLGLLAGWWLWSARHAVWAFALLGISVLGVSLFHLAELYLLTVALGMLLTTALLTRYQPGARWLLFPLAMFAAIILLYFAGLHVGRPPSRSAIIPAVVMVLSVGFIQRLVRGRPGTGGKVLIGALVVVFAIAGISWPHLWALFDPAPSPDPGYYSDYIPKYLVGWGEKLVAIPKWEHQLRASLLWSGALAPLVALWLAWRSPDRRSGWLLTLTLLPWLLLLSPPLFSLAVSPIPVHGGYRVQFLIPVAMVLGLGVSRAITGLSAPGQGRRGSRALSLLVVACSALAIVPDLLTRTGAWADRPWAIRTNTGFHWRALDARPTIRMHSGWAYLEDLRRISAWSREQPPAAFVADLATSYYVAAESALYPAIRQRHHDRLGVRLKRQYHRFCDGESGAPELERGIQRYNHSLRRRNYQRIRYLITNRDTRNYTAEIHGSACVGEIDHLHARLPRIADIVFEGEYLTVWQLRHPSGD